MILDAHSKFVPRAAAVAGLAAVYFALGKLGLKLAIVHPSATAVWPPSGIALAAILLLGYRVWPGIFVGAFAVNVTTTGSILTVSGIAAGNTLEAVAGAWLVQKFARGCQAFDTPRDSFKFAALAGAVCTMIAATFGAGSLTFTGYSPTQDFQQVWLTWWLGDATGILLMTPLLILWATQWPPRWPWRRVLEGVLALFVLIFVALAIFLWTATANRAFLMELVCTPILLWTAFRLGRRAAAVAAVVLSSLAVWATFGGIGLFVGDTPNTVLLLLQTHVAVAAIMALGVAATVFERTQVELRLQEHERQLAQRNSDLEQFVYAASHDLQEPLRTIAIFTEMMVDQYKEKLGKNAEAFMEYIVGGANRMSAMIQALLMYSKVISAEQISFSMVSLDEVVQWAMKNLESSIREGQAQITSDRLPVVLGDREHLVSLLQNLIGNGIKYRGDRPPEIRIAVNQNGRDWIFSVHDTGVGIAPEYHQQIFGVFKRLHGSNIAGTGMGLAISRRIVELHGGRIWVESQIGKGATFFFTIPKREPANSGTTVA